MLKRSAPESRPSPSPEGDEAGKVAFLGTRPQAEKGQETGRIHDETCDGHVAPNGPSVIRDPSSRNPSGVIRFIPDVFTKIGGMQVPCPRA